MRVHDQEWLASLEPGITAARDRLNAARREYAAAHDLMDEACDEWERHPYDERVQDAMNDASEDLDDAYEELMSAISVAEEWCLVQV